MALSDPSDQSGDLGAVAATLSRLVADGLGPAVGLDPDWPRRSAVSRVARLGPEMLGRELDRVYTAHRATFVRYATRILDTRFDAEDVVNEAFARVLRADPDLEVPEALAGYVRTVVRNEAFDRGRQKTRERESQEPESITDLHDRLETRDTPPDVQVCDELSIAVTLNVLSERQRQCFALRYVDGLSVHETAARMSTSEGNVKRLCHEVRSRIAAVLAAA